MDSLSFDGYASYSDASTPRTPSPTDMHFPAHDYAKHDIDRGVRSLFPHPDEDPSPAVLVHPQEQAFWSSQTHQAQQPAFAFNPRSSLLAELYDPEPHDPSLSPPSETHFQQQDSWSQQQQQQQQQQRQNEYTSVRRATFPYVRHDRDDGMPMQQYPPFMQQQQQQQYQQQQQQMQLHHDGMGYARSGFGGDANDGFIPSMSSSPHSSYADFDGEHAIKLEDGTAPLMVPSQTAFYHRQNNGGGAGPSSHHAHPQQQHHHQQQHQHHNQHLHPMNMTLSGYLSPHTGLPVQHTDDAASKETQYLRRRCFNCHTTEPPSWRRSTLNPGKIVCNKCGLYERTHLRPRPLRFDELRAGNKARKASKAAAAAATGVNGGVNGNGVNGTTSPKQAKAVKKEFGVAGAILRRSSVSSSSSVHSGSGASDWDDNVSIYSSGSAPPTSFNSPISHPFPLTRGDSLSPPHHHHHHHLDSSSSSSSSAMSGGIRLPTNPLSDLAAFSSQTQSQSPLQNTLSLSLSGSPALAPLQLQSQTQTQSQSQSQHPTPRKSHTAPVAGYFGGASSSSAATSGRDGLTSGSASVSVSASPAAAAQLTLPPHVDVDVDVDVVGEYLSDALPPVGEVSASSS